MREAGLAFGEQAEQTPVQRLVVAQPGECRRAVDARQAKVEEVSPSEWILENKLAVLPSGKRKTPPLPRPAPDSLLPYLASNAYLVLEDTLLQAAARNARGASADPVKVAAAARKWVSGGFRFRLGAVLFGTSREVLRERLALAFTED